MIALIDGDILRYRIGFACETHYYDVYAKGERYECAPLFTTEVAKERDAWIEQYIGDKADATVKERWIPDKIENCLHSIKVQLEFILQQTGATSHRIFLSGKGNFREDLVDYYKANRKDSRKPFHYENIGEYLLNFWNAEVVEGQEADDALGIAQSKYPNIVCKGCQTCEFQGEHLLTQPKTIICTIDKDLDNICGWHYNFVKDEKYWVDEEAAMYNFYNQLLTGDSTDNIPGLFKITGQKCTKKILEPLTLCKTEEEMWEYVVYVYAEAFYKANPEDTSMEELRKAATIKLTEIGQLLYIRKEEGEMWGPPKAI